MSLLVILYIVCSIWLSIYGFNALALTLVFLLRRRREVPLPKLSGFPTVSVQLPVYNEKYVVKRAIDALVRLDWPRDRLQIQVLDDSTDQTTLIAERRVERYRQQGIDITLLHRSERTGFKAGALGEAMASARGEFVAIFDADFLPPPDFLHRTVPHLVADPRLGFVQARWGHLNRDYSLLTSAQAVALDGHFAVELVAREQVHLLTSFNGTGGIWRRECIESCGGWAGDTLTEDLDLSCRAQVSGWQGLTLPDIVVPSELPVHWEAFKQQQFRWAKGHVQCVVKHAGLLARASLPILTRLQVFIQLTGYAVHPLILITSWLWLPLIWRGALRTWLLAPLSLATLGAPFMYIAGQKALYPDWWRRLKAMPVLICLGTGLSLNTTIAIVEALLGIRSSFQRTPKLRVPTQRLGRQHRLYGLPTNGLPWGEILCIVYGVLLLVAALYRSNPGPIPFLVLYLGGFLYASSLRLAQGNRPKKQALSPSEAGGSVNA